MLQMIMVVAVIAKPQIILSGPGEQSVLDVDRVNLNITAPRQGSRRIAIHHGGVTARACLPMVCLWWRASAIRRSPNGLSAAG